MKLMKMAILQKVEQSTSKSQTRQILIYKRRCFLNVVTAR